MRKSLGHWMLALVLVACVVSPALAAQSKLTLVTSTDNRYELKPWGAEALLRWNNPAAADTSNIFALKTCYPTGTDTTYTFSAANNTTLQTGNTMPRIPMCRTIDIAVCDINGANNNGVKNVTITVTGTNMLDEVITNTYATSDNTAGTIAGTKAFKTITTINVPKMDDNGARVSVGLGDDLGLPFTSALQPVLNCWYNGTIGAITQTTDATDIELCIWKVTSQVPNGTNDYDAFCRVTPLGTVGTTRSR